MHTEIETNGFVINLNYSAKSINRIEREGGGVEKVVTEIEKREKERLRILFSNVR